MSRSVLQVKSLLKDYGSYRAVDHISFEIKQGQILGLLGPNGAGKSTTIQILLGITLPSSGEISYFGIPFRDHRQECLQRINFASAYNTLQERISVQDNLVFFAHLYRIADTRKKIAGLLNYFEITHLKKHRYWDLSAGERTRVNLVKSLLNDPELIMMDEPTAALDPDISDKTLSLIEQLQADRNLSILFTSHNMNEVERICDQVIFLDKGKIISQGTPSEHLKSFGNIELVFYYKGDKVRLEDFLNKHTQTFVLADDHRASVQLDVAEVGSLVAGIIQNGNDIIDMEINKPSLETVFLEIARGRR